MRLRRLIRTTSASACESTWAALHRVRDDDGCRLLRLHQHRANAHLLGCLSCIASAPPFWGAALNTPATRVCSNLAALSTVLQEAGIRWDELAAIWDAWVSPRCRTAPIWLRRSHQCICAWTLASTSDTDLFGRDGRCRFGEIRRTLLEERRKRFLRFCGAQPLKEHWGFNFQSSLSDLAK